MTFRDFMERSLYDPSSGFYGGRTPSADFYTAAELHPAFARILARELAARLDEVARLRPKAPRFIVEMGSGNGTLARQVLTELREFRPKVFHSLRYVLVERMDDLLLGSILSLQDTGAKLMGYTRLEDLQPLCGVFFSNELVDAFPVHLVEKSGGRMREVYVDVEGGRARPTLGEFSEEALRRESRDVGRTLSEGGRHAVGLEACGWMRLVARAIKVGSVITVDYGKRFPPGTPNPPRTYRRHRQGEDVFEDPGLTDITASVDFGRLAEEGARWGLEEVSYSTLGRFLLDRAILGEMPEGRTAEAFSERAKIKTLFHPEGMGEAFKVLVQRKGFPS